MQRDDSTPDGPDLQPPEGRGPESRRRVLIGHPDDGRCRRCDQPIRGRRRNGYCSDRCRLADTRERQRREQLELLNAIEAAVQQLRESIQG